MDKLHSIDEFDKVIGNFTNTLSSFTQDEINQVPFKGSWTAGQVARHILKAIKGVPDLFTYGEVKKTERQPDEKIKAMDELFLNFTTKLKSPDFIIPENVAYNKEELIDSLTEAKNKTVEAAKTKDLTLTSLALEIPGFGHLTFYELLHFMTTHAIRHNRQLENIHEKIAQEIARN